MQIVERVIVRALIINMAAAGFQVACFHDGEDYVFPNFDGSEPGTFRHFSDGESAPEEITRPMTVDEAFEAINSVDEGTLHFTYQHSKKWGSRGVLLILGNGEDVIGDSHSSKHFNEVLDALYEKITAHSLG